MVWRGIIEQYRPFLPISPRAPVITLNEGNTPLIRCDRLGRLVSPDIQLYLKYEGMNPTCSFKDRGMTVAVSKAVEEGATAVICASTGNTSASAAAYAARAGLKAYVVVAKGNIATGKLSQTMLHGAMIVEVEGSFDEALALVRRAAEQYPITLVNSLNPHRIEGQKTAAFEVCDQLGFAPHYHFLPVGNAGNITAYWRGYREYREAGVVKTVPRMMGFQAQGAAPIVRGHMIKNPQTVASAIRIGNPASWQGAVQARDQSGGCIDEVSDEEIVATYHLIARTEGIFAEPASAVGVAGALRKGRQGLFHKGEVVVCTVTGHGLKDPDTAITVSTPPLSIPPRLERLAEVLELK